jgi:hypothetical protein
MGDVPIYVAHDSADVWAHPELFYLDGQGKSTVVSGVPPDYFSATGQLWGNPIYRWDVPAGSGKKALDAMYPLCTLRYSATHADKHHMVYRLDAVDAYERKLVKQIEVASLEVEGGHNKCCVKLIATNNQRGTFSAKVVPDMQGLLGVTRERVTVRPGDDLEQITGRAVYANCLVQAIGCGTDD